MKILYLKYVISDECRLNCSYCTVPKEQRLDKTFLNKNILKLQLFQFINFFKKNNFDIIKIIIGGDELHLIPNFLEYLKDALNSLEKYCQGIDKEKIYLNMHTNLNYNKEFFKEQLEILIDSKRYCTPEFETGFHAYIANKETEDILNFILSYSDKLYINSNVAIDNNKQLDKIKNIPTTNFYDFKNLKIREKLKEHEIFYLDINKNGHISNACGFDINQNINKIEYKNFCEICPHENCIVINGLANRL